MHRALQRARISVSLSVCALFTVIAFAPQVAASEGAISNPLTTVNGQDLAAAVESANREVYVAARSDLDNVSQPQVAPSAQQNVIKSLTTEVDRLTLEAAPLHADGRIRVLDVKVSVDHEERENQVRFVSLAIDRTLDDGQVWEELELYAVVDEPLGSLRPGQFFPVNGDIVRDGQIPEELQSFDGVPGLELEADQSAPVAPSLAANSALLQPSSATPLAANDEAGTEYGHVNAAVNRNAVKDYALRYALNPNTAYYEYPQDCTNFISQALRAGGWTDKKGWYRSDSVWWYTGAWPRASWTWGGAANFFRFARIESGRAGYWDNGLFAVERVGV